MDLARLAFVTLDVPGIGPVVVDAASGAFTEWVRDGVKLRRWSSGDVFVRDILRERARSVGPEAQDPETAPLALSPEQCLTCAQQQPL